jgi:hypothetical protein
MSGTLLNLVIQIIGGAIGCCRHRDSGSCGVLRDAVLPTVIVIEGVLQGS